MGDGALEIFDLADAPNLLTQTEVIRLLRLDEMGLKDPKESLRYLRRTGRLGYVKIAGRILFPKDEISAFLAQQWIRSRQG